MSPSPDDATALNLDALLNDTPDSAADRLRASLMSAAERDAEAAAAVDREAVGFLRQPAAATLLETVGLDLLAELAERCARLLAAPEPTLAQRRQAWDLLDLLRRPAVLRRISAAGAVGPWADRLLSLVESSHLTFGELFAHRCSRYGGRVLFRLPGRRGESSLTWHQVAGRAELAARGLLALTDGGRHGPVAILSENRVEMALVDIACLSSGLVDVMVPAPSSEADVAYILRHCRAGTVVVSSAAQLAKVLACRDVLPSRPRLVTLDPEAAGTAGAIPFEAVLEAASSVPPAAVEARRHAVRIDDLATVMYTSGTTGVPKGITFSHRNIVFKRFARALALPEVGEDDVFVAYLPLFHTFGRFLELAGSIFWGATYCFAENPSIDALARHMREERPTAFISIPMRWMQLLDLIRQEADPETAPAAEIAATVARVTGGRLRWGLSAAGYLDPEVFRFFQRHGVELASGFGMTEATGGITMTPPGQYREDSLGVPLPGIDVRLARDGEMLIRGPYVTPGLLDPPEGEDPFDAEGWLHTGDLMEQDAEGHYRIIDRKKEIYKNVRGQTVAPQKIENLFRDFDSVGRIFLVGDHREHNTALIWPNLDDAEIDLASLSPEELRAHFRSLVVSANSFLAPYERIVDFAIIPRPFSAERGELTPKNTFRRKAVERNFADTIRGLYRGTSLIVAGVEVAVPSWLIQAMGVTAQDVAVVAGALQLSGSGRRLEVERQPDGSLRVGPVAYRAERRSLDLGVLLSVPALWLGNEALVDFADLDLGHRQRRRARTVGIERVGRAVPAHPDDELRRRAAEAIQRPQADLMDVHRAALLLDAASPDDAVVGARLLEHLVSGEDVALAESARVVLRRAVELAHPVVVRRCFEVAARSETEARYRETLDRFLDHPAGVLDAGTEAVLSERQLAPLQLDAYVAAAGERMRRAEVDPRADGPARRLVDFLVGYGSGHPSQYARLRTVLTRLAMEATEGPLRRHAVAARDRLEEAFRAWLGSPSAIAVDPETGNEYRWEDVFAFSDEVDREARQRLLAAFGTRPVLREGIFLFSGGATCRLSDLLPAGVWVKLLGSSHGKSVFRIAVKTRGREQYDLAVNLNRRLPPEEVREETDWLVLCSEDRGAGPLVETFGGYWREHDLWTEEFIPGDTLDRALRREARRGDPDRFRGLWAWAAWAAMAAYVDFWERTGRSTVVADPGAANVIVPMHDYHHGARLVSISDRRPFRTAGAMLDDLWSQLVAAVVAEHPVLEGAVGWETVFSAVLEVTGEAEGLRLLEAAAAARELSDDAAAALRRFREGVGRRGFLPSRLYFAVERFHRWLRVNPGATPEARAHSLAELERTYGIAADPVRGAENRARLYLETVFRGSAQPLVEGLEAVISRLRTGDLGPRDLSSSVADLRARLAPESDDDYFLARLSYPHLRPQDAAGFVPARIAGGTGSEMVVTLEDADGEPYQVRHALSPKEIARLHRLFVAAKLDVHFRPEHRFLVAVSERGHLLGGLFYEVQEEARTAHMDKVVVAERSAGRGVGGALIDELCNRLRSSGYRSLTTGFFRPEFFYRLGFTVERRYAGLVRTLVEPSEVGP